MVLRTAKRMLLMGLGLAAVTAEKAEQVVQEWVKEGELSREEGRELLAAWKSRIEEERQELRERIQKEVNKALTGAGAASQEQLAALEKRVAELERKLGDHPVE